jgi:hypothetical protein
VLYLDIPTNEQFTRLAQTRADACLSIYLPTTTLPIEIDASRIELNNLLKAADAQLMEASFDKRRQAALREHVENLIDDDEFWRFQARSLAVFATPDQIQTFRLANQLPARVEVSDRYFIKPLLRAVTFPHTAYVLALSENGVRLVEMFAEGPPVSVPVPDMPRDAASAVGKSSINDRSPSGRIQGSEGKKVLLTQYARKVDAALRPILAGTRISLFLAAAEPIASIYHSVSSSVDLVSGTIAGNPDRLTDAQLAEAARPALDGVYARRLAELRELFEKRLSEGRATTDLAEAARAAAFGMIEGMALDIDAVVPGTYDESTGQITLTSGESLDTHGVVDAVAARALATGANVIGVRKADLPGDGYLAAILRYAM